MILWTWSTDKSAQVLTLKNWKSPTPYHHWNWTLVLVFTVHKLVNWQQPLSTTLGPNVQARVCVLGCLCFCVCAHHLSACVHVYFPLQKKSLIDSYSAISFIKKQQPQHQDNIQKKWHRKVKSNNETREDLPQTPCSWADDRGNTLWCCPASSLRCLAE